MCLCVCMCVCVCVCVLCVQCAALYSCLNLFISCFQTHKAEIDSGSTQNALFWGAIRTCVLLMSTSRGRFSQRQTHTQIEAHTTTQDWHSPYTTAEEVSWERLLPGTKTERRERREKEQSKRWGRAVWGRRRSREKYKFCFIFPFPLHKPQLFCPRRSCLRSSLRFDRFQHTWLYWLQSWQARGQIN